MNYPNLELLEYKAKQILLKDSEFKTILTRTQFYRDQYAFIFNAIVFPQIWGSTSTGFDNTEGSPTWGGSAMTKEYTTVMCETITGSHVIFFGDKPCYLVNNPNDEFFEDLKNQNMASLLEAKKKYDQDLDRS